MLPGDGFVLALSTVTHMEFGKVKVVNDVTMMVIGTIMSFVLMGGLFGVREGTVLAAVLVGIIIKFIDKSIPKFERFCPVEGHPTLTPKRK